MEIGLSLLRVTVGEFTWLRKNLKWGRETVPFKILNGRGSGNNISGIFGHKGTVTNSALVTTLGTLIHVFIFKAFNGTAI